MYGNDMADFKRQIIVVKDSSQLNYEDSQSVKNVNEIIEGRKNTLSPDLSNFIKIKLQEKKKSSKVSLKTPYLLLSDNNLCNSRNKNNSLKTENSNIAKFPDLKTSNSKLDSTLDSEIIRLKDSKLCSLHSLDTEEKIYSVCNNVLITDSPVLSCKKKNEVKNVLGLKRKLIRKRLFSNVSDKKESMKSNYTFTLKGLHDEKQNPECKNTSEKANSPSNSCSVTNYQNIVSKVEESIEQNKSPNNNISAPYSPILSKCFTKSIKNKSHIRYNCKEMDSVESVLKPVSTLKNVQSLLSTEVIEQSNSLVEHREPYVISPIKFISSQENSVKDLLIKSSNVGVEQDVNVGKNVTNTFHTPLKNNSLCFSKLSEKDQSYFESDEVNTISEFPSPVESEEMYPRYNDKSQTRRTSNFDKVWSIEKNYFENVFKNSKSEKNFEIEYSFSPDDKLKVNKMLSMSTLDKRLSDFSNTFNEFVENSNNISEISSESSPEKNVNTVIETNLNRKRIMLLDTEHVKKKRSNNISPILGIRFNSEKPHCSKYIQELQSDLDGTKFNSEIYNDSTEVCNESTSGFEKKLVDSKSKTASQDGFSNHGNCSLVKQNNQITTSIKNKEEPFLEPITYIHKYQESSEGDLNKSGFFMENDVSDNVVVRNTQSCCSLQINRREYDFIENKQEVLSCTPSNSQISQVIIETVSSPSEATSNKSVDEIQFSDTTSLNTEPQTPPFKVQPEKEKEIFELDSASKKHRKYPDDSLVTRIRILKNRYESNARLWQHMLSNNDNSSKKNHPIFIVKAIWNEYSNTIINCTHLNDTDTDNDVLLTTFEDITTVNTVVNNELHVLINSTVFLPANISRGCNIRIHPPWKILDTPEDDKTVVLGSCLELLTKASSDTNICNDTKNIKILVTKFSCCCTEELVQNPDCKFELQDEQFTELICPPPSLILHNTNQSKRIPKLYFDINHHAGTIGHARAFRLLNPDIYLNVVILTTVNLHKSEPTERGKLFVLVKDLVQEICVIILLTESDVEKWKIGTTSSNKREQVFKLTGIKFVHRIPLKNFEVIHQYQLTCSTDQAYVYYLSPASDWWTINESSCD